MRRHLILRTFLATITSLLVGCGSDAPSADTTQVVRVALDEYSVSPASTEARSGSIRFDVTNNGDMIHEFLVVRSDLALDALPIDAAGDVDERGAGLTFLDEREGIKPGGSVSLPITLDAGRYVLLCNLPGHYSYRMVAAFDVTGPTVTAPTGAGGSSAPSYELVPPAQVESGLRATIAAAATGKGAVAAGGPNPSEVLYTGWYEYEGTIRATDKPLYLDLEDQLAAMKRAADANDPVAFDAARVRFGEVADAYLAAHPG